MECLTSHPNQPHIIAAGCSNGMISLLDIRQEKMPVSLIQAHSHEGLLLYNFAYIYVQHDGSSFVFDCPKIAL